jgi:hypothetical protein
MGSYLLSKHFYVLQTSASYSYTMLYLQYLLASAVTKVERKDFYVSG